MSAANPHPMEKSMVSVLVVANAGGGSPLPCGVWNRGRVEERGDPGVAAPVQAGHLDQMTHG
jgi:hypothetical protein